MKLANCGSAITYMQIQRCVQPQEFSHRVSVQCNFMRKLLKDGYMYCQGRVAREAASSGTRATRRGGNRASQPCYVTFRII
jgi:hypothetical protein